MTRINGIGVTLLGFSEVKDDGSCFATYWFTIIFMPIFPLSRIKLIREITKPVFFKYQVVLETNFVMEEVLKTYLYSWVLFPLFIFGIPFFAFIIGPSDSGFSSLIVGSIWTFISIWKLWNWGQSRGLPNKDAEENNIT